MIASWMFILYFILQGFRSADHGNIEFIEA